MTFTGASRDSAIEKKLFTWRPVRFSTLVPSEILHGMTELEEQFTLDQLRKNAVYQVRTGVLSFDLPGHKAQDTRTVTFEVPTTPWQHFKHAHRDAWWMRWLVARRPVTMRKLSETLCFEAEWKEYAVYPWQQVAPISPRLGPAHRHVELLMKVTEQPDAPAGGDQTEAS